MKKKDFYEEIDVTELSSDDMRRINIMLKFILKRNAFYNYG